MRILVTGCAGFVGPWLVAELVRAGHTVVGTALHEAPAEGVEGGRLIAADLLDEGDARAVADHARADACIHLAGWSHVGDSWLDPAAALEANALAGVRTAQALARAGTRRLVFVGTSEVYGIVSPEELPLREESPLRPANPYAASKLAAEEMLRVLAKPGGLSLTIARPFSHTGPGQTTKFVCPAFAEQVARVARGEQDAILHGDLSPRRDFLDVRDVVRAYRLIAEGDFAGRVFNIASGRSVAIGDVLAKLLSLAGLPGTTARVDPARLRPVDLPELRGSHDALRSATGWEPAIPFERTLADLLAHFGGAG